MSKIKKGKHCQECRINGTLIISLVGIQMCLVFHFGKQFDDFYPRVQQFQTLGIYLPDFT